MSLKAFIIVYNRLTWPKKIAEDLVELGCVPIIIDNNSDYPPLLEWYASCPFKVHRMEKNYLSSVLWKSGLIQQYSDQYFIQTDCDLDISGVPKDCVDVLFKALANTDSTAWKAGLSLEIDDLPQNDYTQKVIAHERAFWSTPLDNNGFYKSNIASTLALYDMNKNHGIFLDSIRAPKPYTARHLPWYFTKETLTEEEKYFVQTCKWNGWTQYLK